LKEGKRTVLGIWLVLSLPPAGPEVVLPLLDRYAEVARALR